MCDLLHVRHVRGDRCGRTDGGQEMGRETGREGQCCLTLKLVYDSTGSKGLFQHSTRATLHLSCSRINYSVIKADSRNTVSDMYIYIF